MPFADSCIAVMFNCSNISWSFNTIQTSQGKTFNFHHVDAEFIKYRPFADGGLNGHVPTGPTCISPLIRFLFIAP